MAKGGVSLYFTIQDRASSVLSGIGDKTKALDKETQSLAQSAAALTAANKPLIQQQAELKTKLEVSAKAVKDARKAFMEYGDEASKDRLSSAIQEQDELRRELKDTEDQLKSNQKTYQEYREAIRKGSLEAESLGGGGASGGAVDSGISALANGLASSGLLNQLSGSLTETAGTMLSSALGDRAADAISGLLGSTMTGAAAGAVAGPLGALIGAGVGAVSGVMDVATQQFKDKDEVFLAYSQELADKYADHSDDITSGSSIAAGRETDLLSFTTLFGERSKAEGYLADLVEMSNRTPFLYGDLTAMSKTLATYGFDDKRILPVLTKIGDAGAALGLATSDMTTVATALGRMQTTDKAALEYINMLSERGINAVGYLSEARGESVADTYSAISKGEISGTDAVDIILTAMGEAFGGSMEEQSQTFSGLSSTLEGLQQEIQNAAGEGYNQVRAEGVQEGIDAYSGPLGEYLQQMNTIVGENQAYLENLSDQYQRDALTALFTGEISDIFTPAEAEALTGMHDEFASLQEAVEAGDPEAKLQMQGLYEQAQIIGEDAFNTSEYMQQAHEIEQDHLDAIKETLASSEAIEQKIEENTAKTAGIMSTEAGKQEYASSPAGLFWWTMTHPYGGGTPTGGYAVGLPYVPEDNFPALLHEGERVLTAREARAYNAAQAGGGTSGIVINVSGLSVREEADVEKIAARLLEEIQLAQMAG